jgi:hypothetical protein
LGFPLKTSDSDVAAQRVRELYELGHVPSVLHGDSEFANAELAKVCKDHDVKFIKKNTMTHMKNLQAL